VDVDDVAEVSEIPGASIFRVGVCRFLVVVDGQQSYSQLMRLPIFVVELGTSLRILSRVKLG
jgi:hypothetical protein